MKAVDISKKYELLDEIQHVLKRPGMYIGSTKPHQSSEYFLTNGKFQKEEIEFNPGFLKLFDEIVSNSVDESKRNKTLDTIVVNINEKTKRHYSHIAWHLEMDYYRMICKEDDTGKDLIVDVERLSKFLNAHPKFYS